MSGRDQHVVKNDMIAIEMTTPGGPAESVESATQRTSIAKLETQVASLRCMLKCISAVLFITLVLAIAALPLALNSESTQETTIKELDRSSTLLNKTLNTLSQRYTSLEIASKKSPAVILSTTPKAVAGYSKGDAAYAGMGEWLQKKTLPQAMSDGQSVTCNGKIYLLGGMSSGNAKGKLLNSTIAYNPFYETTNAMAGMIHGRYRFGAACVNDTIFVAGGFTEKQTGNMCEPSPTLEAYSTVTNTWSTKANMSMGRGDIAMAVSGRKLYVFGGYGYNYDMAKAGTMTEVYDLAAGTWSTKKAMPTSRGDIAAVAVRDEIYVVGGWSSDYPPKPLATVEKYTPATDTWQALPSLHTPRGDSGVVVVPGAAGQSPMIVVVGGETVNKAGAAGSSCWIPGGCLPVHDTELFDLTHQVWTKMAPSSMPRYRFSTAYGNGAVFVFGGQTHGEVAVSSVETFYYVAHRSVFFHYKNSSWSK